MTRLFSRLLPGLAALMLLASCHSTVGDAQLPSAATRFIQKYFPATVVDSKEETSAGDFVVVMLNGPTLTFDNEGSWTRLNGNGSPLPQIIVFDYFPQPLYDYVESLEQTAGVYTVSRNFRYWDVLLHSAELRYDVNSQSVSEL